MTFIPNTENNVNLARAVNNRIRSDGVMLSAKASLWRFGGIGLLIASAGIGVGAALYGYSYVNDSRTSVEKMSEAIASAIEKSSIGVKGSVGLEPGGKVSIEPGGKVGLESGGKVEMVPGVVSLKPGSRVGIEGKPTDTPTIIRSGESTRETPRPTQGQMEGKPQVIQPTAKIVTNFTIFKSVEFGNGRVETGWKYISSEQDSPESQYCYYKENATTVGGESTTNVTHLAENGHRTGVTGKSFNDSAAAQCIWFNGEQTVTDNSGQTTAQAQPEQSLPPPSSMDDWCKAVKLPSSIALCSDWSLRRMSLQRNAIFESARGSLSAETYEQLLQDQRAWVKSYALKCGIADNVPPKLPLSSITLACLKRAGTLRVTYLNEYIKTHKEK